MHSSENRLKMEERVDQGAWKGRAHLVCARTADQLGIAVG